jgi:hypothetical protein
MRAPKARVLPLDDTPKLIDYFRLTIDYLKDIFNYSGCQVHSSGFTVVSPAAAESHFSYYFT